jgi:hypothetical protein
MVLARLENEYAERLRQFNSATIRQGWKSNPRLSGVHTSPKLLWIRRDGTLRANSILDQSPNGRAPSWKDGDRKVVEVRLLSDPPLGEIRRRQRQPVLKTGAPKGTRFDSVSLLISELSSIKVYGYKVHSVQDDQS